MSRSSVTVRHHLDSCIDALIAGDNQALAHAAREAITRAEDAAELIGRFGLLALQGDQEGHAVLTLAAASVLTRWLIALRHVLGEDTENQSQINGLPLVLQALPAAAAAVKAGKDAPQDYPKAIFPSELGKDEPLSAHIERAITAGDTTQVERLLFGLYRTGADYRTLGIRIYDGISRSFQENGHALLYAVRGAQLLNAVEWGEDTPYYIHWLVPHLPRHEEEPSWTQVVRGFLREPQHSLASYRVRLAAPRNEQALPLRELLLGEATTAQVCQAVYDALIKNGASAAGVGSVIALAAADLLRKIGADEHDLFIRASHGLLFASATRLVYSQVQEIEALPLLFSAAAAVNALAKELAPSLVPVQPAQRGSAGGGLIAPALLENLIAQIEARDLAGAMSSARRAVQLGHDTRALFGVIALGAAQADATADQGHTLQIVLAAGDAYLAWPGDLAGTNTENFLYAALRAVTQATRTIPARI